MSLWMKREIQDTKSPRRTTKLETLPSSYHTTLQPVFSALKLMSPLGPVDVNLKRAQLMQGPASSGHTNTCRLAWSSIQGSLPAQMQPTLSVFVASTVCIFNFQQSVFTQKGEIWRRPSSLGVCFSDLPVITGGSACILPWFIHPFPGPEGSVPSPQPPCAGISGRQHDAQLFNMVPGIQNQALLDTQ